MANAMLEPLASLLLLKLIERGLFRTMAVAVDSGAVRRVAHNAGLCGVRPTASRLQHVRLLDAVLVQAGP